MKLLSILIPTLPARLDSYYNLMKKLTEQIKLNNLQEHIQVMSFMDTKDISVGQKRNILLENSCGRYVCFVDDDDDVSDNYILSIYHAIPSNADVITFCGDYIENNKVTPFSISMLHRFDMNEHGMFYRLPNHLCPVKREIALASRFTDKNFGEDSDYAKMINTHIKSEYHIKDKLYFYMYDANTSQTSPNSKRSAYN